MTVVSCVNVTIRLAVMAILLMCLWFVINESFWLLLQRILGGTFLIVAVRLVFGAVDQLPFFDAVTQGLSVVGRFVLVCVLESMRGTCDWLLAYFSDRHIRGQRNSGGSHTSNSTTGSCPEQSNRDVSNQNNSGNIQGQMSRSNHSHCCQCHSHQ